MLHGARANRRFDTIQDLILQFERNGSTSKAIEIFEENSLRGLSYRELFERIEFIAEKLLSNGVKKGDYVLLFAPNSIEWIICCLAAFRMGAVIVPVDSQSDEENLGAIFKNLDPSFVFTTVSGLARLSTLFDINQNSCWLIDQDLNFSSQKISCQAQTYYLAKPSDIAVLFFTSGTTGTPKGVPLSHTNLIYQIDQLINSGLAKEGDTFLMPLPMHHVYPFVVGILAPLSLNCRIVLPQSLTGPRLLQAINKGHVNVLIGVPRLYESFFKAIEERIQSLKGCAASFKLLYGLSQSIFALTKIRMGKLLLAPLHKQIGKDLRVLTCGGAPISGSLVQNLGGLGYQVAIGYGLTETSPLLTLLTPDCGHFQTVGKNLKGTEIKIDQNGEILARGPGVFKGYLNALKGSCLTDDGWFRTGDCGTLQDGFLKVEGRSSAIIVSETGKKIDPELLEEHYQKELIIKEIGVLQRGGKLVGVVFPDLQKIQEANFKSIDAAIHDAIDRGSLLLPAYKRLSGYVIVSENLPRTAMGKIKRHKLAFLYDTFTRKERLEVSPEQWWQSLSDADKELMNQKNAKIVMKYLNDRLKVKQLSLDTNLQLDLGIDSLEWLEISLDIRDKSGVELNQDTIASISTLRDLLEAVVKNGGNHSFSVDPFLHWQKCLSREQTKWLTPKGHALSLIQRSLYKLNRIFFRVYFKLKVEGLEHIDLDAQYVFVPNHSSYLDPFTLAAALPPFQLLKTQWAGWVGIAFANSLARLGSRVAGVIPIDAENALSSSLALATGVLENKRNLVWFPEGRRTLSGELQEFKGGIGLLLSHKPVLVIPVYMKNVDRALSPGDWMLKPVQILVRFGEARTVAKLVEEGVGETDEKRIVDALFKEVSSLSGECAQSPLSLHSSR